jgi:xanthine dehydrogenase accessory factor
MSTNEPNLPANKIAKAIERVLAAGGTATLVTLVEAGENIGAKLLVADSGESTGTLGDKSLDQAVARFAKRFRESAAEAHTFRIDEFAPELGEWSEARVLCERIEPEARIVVCGAGHVGAALAQFASLAGYRTTLIDDRAEFVTRERFPSPTIELIAATNWTVAVREAIGNGRGVAVAVVTRGHNEDEECMQAIMSTNADYVGLIGSKRRTNIVLDRLRQAGVAEERLKKTHAPIGLDIGAVTPEEVALAILAEIVAERRGGKGSSLSAWRRNEK